MMKHTLFSLSILVLCNSCGDRKEEANIRDLSKVNNTISTCSFIEQVDFIPLHEKDSFLLGEINAIRKYDGKWYVLDNKQKTAIVAFDSVGQPVSLYDKTGNGKGEYAEITGFDVSPETGDVCVLCGPPKIIILDKDLKFKQEIKLSDYYWRICWYDAGFLLYSANNATVDYITLEQGKARKIFQAESDMYNVAGTEPVFIRDNDNLYFHTEQSDALYEIKDFEFVPVVSLDYPLKKETEQILRKRYYGDLNVQERMKYVRPTVNCVIGNDTCLSFIYSRMLYYINMPYENHYINSVLKIDCGRSTMKTGNQLISWKYISEYDPESYSDDRLYKGVKVNHPVMNDSLRRSGNPMLVLYTLKKTFGE